MLLEKEDEMDCLVGGANFLLKAIHHEAFMYENSQTLFTPSNCEHPSLVTALHMAATRQCVSPRRPCTDSGAWQVREAIVPSGMLNLLQAHLGRQNPLGFCKRATDTVAAQRTRICTRTCW